MRLGRWLITDGSGHFVDNLVKLLESNKVKWAIPDQKCKLKNVKISGIPAKSNEDNA